VNPLRLQALALGVSLAHVLVDSQMALLERNPLIGDLFPPSDIGLAPNIAAHAAIYALWAWALGAAGGSRGPVAALVIFAGGWAATAQGLVGLASCPPPCGGSPGLRDAAHLLSLVFGSWAAYATARALRESAGAISWWPSIFALALTAAGFVLQSMTFGATR
jgi:hypothetical protein